MGCCFSSKSSETDDENRDQCRQTGRCNQVETEEIALKLLNKRLDALYNGNPPKRASQSDAPRLSELAALEIRLEKLQQPLATSVSEEDDEESPGRRSSEIVEELQERLRALGSGSVPEPCDLRKLEVPPKEMIKKKKLYEEKHIEDLSTRLLRLHHPLTPGSREIN